MNPGHTEDNYSVITSESCTCPGDELIFECTIEGDAGTYWQGTALEQCLQGRVLIRHSQFRSGALDTLREMHVVLLGQPLFAPFQQSIIHCLQLSSLFLQINS